MLGKLFNLGSGSNTGTPSSAQSHAQKPSPSLESVTEDIHTRNLLFPDTQALFQHRHDQVYPLSSGSALPATASTNAFDYDGDIELEPRDVRVIIMQDALSSVAASLLYDSQPPPSAPTSPMDRPPSMMSSGNFQESRRMPSSARKPSITQAHRPVIVQPDSPQLRQGAFDQRRPSVHTRNQTATESDSQRAWREYREEITTFSSCIFGNSELMAYKGTSSKVHVVPSDPRPYDYAASIIGDGRGSLGRSSMRSSRLSQSFTSENMPMNAPPTPTAAPRFSERKKVLITRLFPVNLPADDETTTATPQSRFAEDSSGYPFPMPGDEGKKRRKPQLKQKRTPMYAIALVVNLPPGFSSGGSGTRSGFRGPGSFTDQESSFPSSLSSTRRSGWTMVGQGGHSGGYGLDSLESAISGDIEDRLDVITQHWDIIMRTLTHLQSVVATTIFTMLKQIDLSSPDPTLPGSLPGVPGHIPRSSSMSLRRGEDTPSLKPPKTNAKNINLLPNCLLDNRTIAGEIDIARTRIVSGLRATRVITGQNRWGIWREEARWVAKWADDHRKSFFFNLMTAFQATHTDWLQALAPSSYRRRHFIQQRAQGEEEAAVPARTIIVAQDKMAARRLVFLLSAFLPATQQALAQRPHRPSTSASFGAFSQSPPSYVVPILKEESLRRRINRRTGPGRASHSRNASLQGLSRPAGVPGPLAHLTMEGRHERRSSDTLSIRTTYLNLPVTEVSQRKSSAATMATITPETSIAHFTSVRRGDPFSPGRPGSSGSVATDDLKRLATHDSTGLYGLPGTDSRQSTKWGLITGLWGAKRRGSTSTAASTPHARDSSPTSPVKRRAEMSSRISSDIRRGESPAARGSFDAHVVTPEGKNPVIPRQITEEIQGLSLQPETSIKNQRTPDPSGAFESPVKTSINVEDGVIDVDIPFPDYLTSFETAVSSPSSSGFLSTAGGFGSGVDAFEQSSRGSVDGDVALNVAGWLQGYHPDFALQAIPAQNDRDGPGSAQRDLTDQVKASLRAEATPASAYQGFGADSTTERWVDVSSAIIADATNFTVTRIRYRRLVKPKALLPERGTPVLSASFPASYTSSLLTPAISPYEVQLEEEFHEEVIDSADDLLVEAVEKVIALSADASKGSSNCSSRSASKRRERSNSESTQSDGPSSSSTAAALAVPTEVPRAQCKTVILSALEEIIQQVLEKRDRGAHGNTETDEENVLRRAVRGWLDAVDQGD
ncbi:folliculin-interacting protein N-terminus-domain-containing protein [Coniochaeta sp. 2T2.1]|nr:folliculin-interacting protein N-terminus-domain-containing protein [Coniochaeta sp. 2T2.1]